MTPQPNTLTLSDLRDGDEVILDNARVRFNAGHFRLQIQGNSVHWLGPSIPAFARATIPRVPREFVKGDRVIHRDGCLATVIAVDGDEAWVIYDSGFRATWSLSYFRHADEVGG